MRRRLWVYFPAFPTAPAGPVPRCLYSLPPVMTSPQAQGVGRRARLQICLLDSGSGFTLWAPPPAQRGSRARHPHLRVRHPSGGRGQASWYLRRWQGSQGLPLDCEVVQQFLSDFQPELGVSWRKGAKTGHSVSGTDPRPLASSSPSPPGASPTGISPGTRSALCAPPARSRCPGSASRPETSSPTA